MFGGAGNDTLYGHDAIYGEEGDDTLFVEQSYYTGTISGGDGNDRIVIRSTRGVSSIFGKDGADVIRGNTGSETGRRAVHRNNCGS
ncbi:hemolysin-type calcium-binding region [Erythrobacter sp. SD-21]|uniref:hemolysin-type calcium-binding region n=1 Tax=Erythrobacter sp. SD-21 TaxID=161528 RepID=UPI000153F5A7|nr:hemolysin-type calcium-binding region [Erythrobacter sp. SD-21]EDL49352.1 Hemolysin-type calcium-binding region [Erythrobacter sp. SD-21]